MAKALSVEKPNKLGTGCVVAFSLVFVVAGLVMLYFLTIRPLLGVATAGDWKETPCTILSSEVGVHRGDGTTYSIDIEYEYVVDEKRYQSDRYSFWSEGSSSGRSGKAEVVRQYPKGAMRTCFVDPDDPESAVLNKSLTSSMWWGLFPLPFVGFGAFVLFHVVRGKKPKQPGSSTQPAEVSSFRDRNFADGPIDLKESTSPGCALIGITAACLFWNGIVSVFLFQLFDEFQWFLALFLIPFVLIGIGMIGAVFYQFIALFNPRPMLTLSRGAIPLGETVQLNWRFKGSTRSIQRLKISLRAQEHATYRRGTDTVTDKETFFEDVLVDAQGMMPEIAEGTAEITIPTDRMHSFESDNNKIIWSIVLHGDIPFRPDVKADFLFQVIPHVEN